SQLQSSDEALTSPLTRVVPQLEAPEKIATKMDAEEPVKPLATTPPLTLERLFAENASARGIRSAFQAQPQDSQLAYEAENRWRQFYAEKAEMQQYGTPQVECGAKFCEIRLLANGINTP